MIINSHKERKCQNEECDCIIPKEANPKKLFCSLSCKNRHHYERNNVNNNIFEIHAYTLKRNRNILLAYICEETYKLSIDTMEHLGFNRKAFIKTKKIKKIKGDYLEIYIIDGIGFWVKNGICNFNFLEDIEV
jgi:precorrin-6B methylase 2